MGRLPSSRARFQSARSSVRCAYPSYVFLPMWFCSVPRLRFGCGLDTEEPSRAGIARPSRVSQVLLGIGQGVQIGYFSVRDTTRDLPGVV